MSLVEQLLATDATHRIDREIPTTEELRSLEELIDRSLPRAYVEFLRLGGLGDLRFSNEVLAPDEIAEAITSVRRVGLVPFASNGCGDLFCWQRNKLPHSKVVYWEHEESKTHDAFETFESALQAWRS